jgi:hypothetical protein
MHAPLAFLARPEGGTAKISREWLEASDWAVLFTLGTLFFLLGAFAMWAWIIWRRSTKPEPHVKLLMELEEEAEREKHATTMSEEPETQAPWEQSADWWKKADH